MSEIENLKTLIETQDRIDRKIVHWERMYKHLRSKVLEVANRESTPPSTRHELLSEIGRKLKLLRDDYEKARMYTQVDTLDYVTHYLVSGILNQESPSKPSPTRELDIVEIRRLRELLANECLEKEGRPCAHTKDQNSRFLLGARTMFDRLHDAGRLTLTTGTSMPDERKNSALPDLEFERDTQKKLEMACTRLIKAGERIAELEKELAQLRAKALAEG